MEISFQNAVKQIAMKTKINFTIVILLLMTLFAAGRNVLATTTGKDTLAVKSSISVSLPVVEEESYVDDIPFDTKAIAMESLYMNMVRPAEEAYINDIPFNTEEIASLYNAKLLSFTPPEEAYVDDIPYDTQEIANSYLMNCKNMASVSNTNKCEE